MAVETYETIIVLYRFLMAFAFMAGIFIFFAPRTYNEVNRVLMREYGIKKRFIPWLEEGKSTLDGWILKRRGLFGVLLICTSFVLMVSVK